jgi:hypothetical protein
MHECLTFIPRARALLCLDNWPDLAKRLVSVSQGQGNGPLDCPARIVLKIPTINLSGASVSRVRSRFWLESPFCGFEWYHVHGALKSYKRANHAAVPNTPALHLIHRAV